MEEFKNYDEKIKELGDFISTVTDADEALVDVLHEAQRIFGYIPTQVQHFIAEKLDSNPAEVYGVITFYPASFRTKPQGDFTINVCNGTACHVAGANDVLNEFAKILKIGVGETTYDGKFSLKSGRCVGACAMNPVVTVGDDIYSKVTPKDVATIIEKYI